MTISDYTVQEYIDLLHVFVRFFCNATTIPKVIQTMLSAMLFVITSVIILAKSKR